MASHRAAPRLERGVWVPSAAPRAPSRAGLGPVAVPSPAAGSYLDVLYEALERAECQPMFKTEGRLRATCPVCWGGSTGKRGKTIAAAEKDDRLLMTCFRCAPEDCPVPERKAWLVEFLDLLGLAAEDIGLARQCDDIVQAAIDEYRASIGVLQAAGHFKGQRGDTDLRILTAAWRFARRVRSITFFASERQWALATGRGRDTCRRTLPRLIATGWLDLVEEWGVAVDRQQDAGIRLRGRQWRLSTRYKKGLAFPHSLKQVER